MRIWDKGSKDVTEEKVSEEICSDPLQAADVEDINWNQIALMTLDCCFNSIKIISA